MSLYKTLEVWKNAISLAQNVYLITKNFPAEEKFGLTMQLRRASVSIASNIAEGLGRKHDPDKLRFMHIARGSAYEVETQLELAKIIGYLSDENFGQLEMQLVAALKPLSGLIKKYDR